MFICFIICRNLFPQSSTVQIEINVSFGNQGKTTRVIGREGSDYCDKKYSFVNQYYNILMVRQLNQ